MADAIPTFQPYRVQCTDCGTWKNINQGMDHPHCLTCMSDSFDWGNIRTLATNETVRVATPEDMAIYDQLARRKHPVELQAKAYFDELEEFRMYLASCTDQQVRGVFKKEREAYRSDNAVLARAELVKRGLWED